MPNEEAGGSAPDTNLLRIERFDTERHDRDGFDCGVNRLNNYLKRTAKKQQADDMTRVYVAVAEGDPASRILGYHAIGVGSMDVAELARRPRGAPAHGDLPVLFLGQVAVAEAAQGRGIGAMLMHHVFEKARVVADQARCYVIVLDVMSDGPEGAFERRRDWYASFGFAPFASIRSRMFMTMAQVRAVLDMAD